MSSLSPDNMEFIAIDVETANANMASICQIGLAHYKNGKIIEEFSTYIDPQDYFDPGNISIHGINDDTVVGAPTIRKASKQLYAYLDKRVTVCHTHFDRVAIEKACAKNSVRTPACTWLDSACVARRAWPNSVSGGYGIHNLCHALGYKFKHHDALEDAKAAGHILLAASKECNHDIQGWLKRVTQPVGATKSRRRGL